MENSEFLAAERVCLIAERFSKNRPELVTDELKLAINQWIEERRIAQNMREARRLGIIG